MKLDRMTRSAVSGISQIGHHERTPRHRPTFGQAAFASMKNISLLLFGLIVTFTSGCGTLEKKASQINYGDDKNRVLAVRTGSEQSFSTTSAA
jgi:hypothetical protein